MLEGKINIKPFSVNRMFFGKHRITKDYRNWETECLWKLKPLGQIKPPKARSVEIIFHLDKSAFAKSDVDNLVKSCLDILVKAKIIKDDRYIDELFVKKVKSDYAYIEFKIL